MTKTMLTVLLLAAFSLPLAATGGAYARSNMTDAQLNGLAACIGWCLDNTTGKGQRDCSAKCSDYWSMHQS